MVFEKDFLKLTVIVCFQNNECFENVTFLTYSIGYNVVVTKIIYFSPQFLKSWPHIFDNTAGVVGDQQLN